MNSVNLVGRLTRDPELRSIDGGQPVCEMRIAVDNGASREGSDRDPTYVDVASFGPQAEACARYLVKGRQVAVAGRLLYREWEAEDGSKRSKHSVLGRVEFLGKGPDAEQNGAAAEGPVPAAVGAADEDIVF